MLGFLRKEFKTLVGCDLGLGVCDTMKLGLRCFCNNSVLQIMYRFIPQILTLYF